MTVIAWDGMTLAADKLACNGSTKITTTKIRRFGGVLLAVCGDYSVGMEMLDWYERGAKPAEYPPANRNPNDGASLIAVTPEGVWKYESSPLPFRVEDPFAAFGSGAEGALVAMACGKTAAEAVRLVCQFNNGCGNGVDTLTLEPL